MGGCAGVGREGLEAMEMDQEQLEAENRARLANMREWEREERGEAGEREARSGSCAVPAPVTIAPSVSVSKRDLFIVISPANEVHALKYARLDRKVDEETMRRYVDEMLSLKQLDGNEWIIKLVDSQAHGKGDQYLMMVCASNDPAFIVDTEFNLQMLETAQTIHEEKIVHSELKPANFVLVKGSLKFIDFRVAKAIANDTTNIQQEHQVGTLNDMSPESMEETQTANGRRLKLGRASDVWSLGCILYQMIYDRPRFHAIPGLVGNLRQATLWRTIGQTQWN
ncbi:Dual-specificity kinase, spindle pole body (SPB) duplication and spindle checkpoint function [Ceratobasidium sp. 394]|nr:Dual-specificity kinase, spindle pole body (SPB) duplication and spindle checkpoint function [Ceratobasidium sp. 394]